MILTEVYTNEETVCSSTEELLAEVERINESDIDETFIIGSMDVEALYPSLDIPFTIEKVCELFHESDIQIEEIDYKELGLYLSLTHTDQQLREKGLYEACAKRRFHRGFKPTITGCGMEDNEEKRYRPWIFPNVSRVTLNL